MVSELDIPAGGPVDQQILAYAQNHAETLESAPGAAAESAIKAILSPLENPKVSVSFRLRYGAALAKSLDTMIAGEDVWRRLTAVHIAARIATTSSVRLVYDSMRAKDKGDRYFAVASAEAVFAEVARTPPAVTPADLERLIDRIAEDLETDPDPLLVDVRVRALIAAAAIPDNQASGVAVRSASNLAARVAARVRQVPVAAGPADRRVMLAAQRAALFLRDDIANGGRTTPAEIGKAAAGLAGDMIALAAARVRSGDAAPGDEASGDAQFLRLAGVLLNFADLRLAEATGAQPVFNDIPDLGQLLGTGDLRTLNLETSRLLQRLGEAPFGFDPKRFAR